MSASRRPLARAHIGARQLVALLGNWDRGEAVYAALAARIALLLDDGRIAPYTRLPAERELAEALGRSRTTIVAAYSALRESGHLISVRGSGSVAVLPQPGPDGQGAAEIDFARAMPPPVAGLAEMLRGVGDTVPELLLRPGFDLIGERRVRELIAARYTESGARTAPEQIMVTLGAQHAIALVARTVLRQADRVVVEAPTYPHAYEAILSAGGRLASTPVSDSGWDLDHLTSVLERIRPELLYLIPDFHNPTGASMPADHRERVLAAARRAGTLVLVDETTADLDIDRPGRPPSFAAVAGDRSCATVVSVGSLSKSIWGGLRVGWIRADPALISRLLVNRPAGDLGTPVIDQMVAAAALADYDVLLGRRSEQLRDRRDLLTRLLRTHLPDWHTPRVHGGLSLWVGLGAPLSSALASAGQRRGVRITAGPKFGIDGAHERFIRVPFTGEPERIERGVRILRDTWSSLDPLAGRGAQHHLPPTL
ncbi:MocR-like transcription factor YczR [Mycolicibacterium palauense]|uniref:MocR-like transcription factor YczR n=1 Tax=Mycolicibacterium palauense TaxID=2034511 RepID=UPI001FE7CCF9|nr:PLP-dependent aminotransferase family protein [Mycolicibacterium palauense]